MASTRPSSGDRAAIPERYRWDLSPIFPDWAAWEEALTRLGRLMEEYQQYRETLGRGPERVLAANRLSDELGQLVYRVYQYPSLMLAQDTRDNDVQARLERVRIALARFHQATAWYVPELLAIPEGTMRSWLEETPDLAPYRFPIEETYRKQQHVLDEAGERLLAYAGPLGAMPARAYGMLADADVVFPEVTLSDGNPMRATHANYSNGLHTLRDAADREALFRGHFSVFDGFPNAYAAIYDGVLQNDWFVAQARGYPSTLEAALDEDGIPTAVVESLLAAAKAGVEPLRRYHRLRRRALGLERYRYFDAYLPLVEEEWCLPYDEVRPLLSESVAVFGADYRSTAERAFCERWIDVYENQGKRSGAFSAGVYGVHPYLLLNYADTVGDAFTVAHEMGHTMHTELACAAQPFATSSYSIFVAEVASMTSEELFGELLLARENDPRRRVILLQHAIDDLAASFYRQAMFADFELAAHRLVERGEPTTAAALQELYLRSLSDFFGDTLDDQDWYRNTWARIPHFYGSSFYVYQYATSKAAASLLHLRMSTGPLDRRRATVAGYLDLLAAGGSDNPVELLRRAGVDLTAPKPVAALVAKMGDLVDRLEAELGALER